MKNTQQQHVYPLLMAINALWFRRRR